MTGQSDHARLDRADTYRGRALKPLPGVRGRCGRIFDSRNLRRLPFRSKNHNHDNSPPDTPASF